MDSAEIAVASLLSEAADNFGNHLMLITREELVRFVAGSTVDVLVEVEPIAVSIGVEMWRLSGEPA
jgi:hypothetical protein